MTALCSIYYLHLFTFLLFFATLCLTLYFLFFNFTSNSLLNLLFSFLLFIFLPFIFQESFRDARRTHTNNTHAVCRDFPNYLPFALSPFEFLPLFAKTIASFSLSILLFRHARTHTYQSSRHKQHDNLRLLKIFPTFAFFFDNSSCQITRNRNRKPFLLRGWRRSLCSLRRDATFTCVCV